ncbi:MAG TPA: N-acyl homoserine lactonase family protein [Acidiphilium sp.]|jgi:glyoxylase-like metal-dependent hydrolase (beta-lactamase superfamily II)|uniref:N-acyl homoserine lactonase family protein n=1 Tax=unclassified Acidiphilium TaxID=2617493 RepID=UPI00157B1FBE|nr:MULTISPECIES: N-acyl homoserine lactonase family protein [unclassified Acidiphilium]HQT62825.1 N-acyl homoserine lactonase family protein [Acidiphilium sp.]HQU12450.1 N-acyl homoserine lactonase family protein [Acidiphilium sp.]
MTGGPAYEIHALRYGTHVLRADQVALGSAPEAGGGVIDYFVWAICDGSRCIVVDTGFGSAAGQRRGRTMLADPVDLLAAIGIDAGAVTDVVLTHLHYDHAGNYDAFPKATFHLQDREMAHATGRHMGRAITRGPYECDEVVGMVRQVFGGRVRFHDGDAEIAPGVSIHRIGGHAPGLQVVRVATGRGKVVLASDASHFYSGYLHGAVFPILFHIGEMLDGYRRIRELADGTLHVIPGHDPIVLQLFPASTPALAGTAARLDLPPDAELARRLLGID